MARMEVGAARPEPAAKPHPELSPKPRTVDSWMGEDFIFSALVIKKQSLILFLLRLPAFIPWIFVARGWFSLNEKDSLTNTEADILGTGGEIAFFLAVSITPLITVTGARWFAPLRRWYGIMFMLIGISDATTAAISTDFAGGVFGRLAGHTFLVTGLFIVLMGIPVLATANTPAQRRLGKHWKSIQRVTYALWALIVVHLLLLDGFKPFQTPEGDGDPVFHQRFYQAVAISLPLVILRLPPVRRWVISKRESGQQWKVWLLVSVIGLPYVVGMIYIINEEIFTGMMCLTMHPPAN
jgi:DMSO/TMAO reductase YedYZ heme-binding membrane subunit